MVNYKEMYFNLYARMADLTDQMIKIQQEVEELYLAQCDENRVIEFKKIKDSEFIEKDAINA